MVPCLASMRYGHTGGGRQRKGQCVAQTVLQKAGMEGDEDDEKSIAAIQEDVDVNLFSDTLTHRLTFPKLLQNVCCDDWL